MSNPNFCRGARPTPRHKLLATPAFHPELIAAPPAQFAMFPPKEHLNNFGNDQFGDCVTAEECYAKVAYAHRCGLSLTISRDLAIQAARSFGGLNGADLQDIMQKMASRGLTADDGQKYKDGGFKGVDYTDVEALKAAITVGPVKLGIDANGLPSGAGSVYGWYSTSGNHHGNEDHSVTLDSFGPAQFLFDALKVQLPSGLSPNTFGFGLFTWNTIGFVVPEWLRGSCQEAYVRNPTTIGQSPTPPPPVGVPPFKLYEGDMASPVQKGDPNGYGDFAQARSQAQGFADGDKVAVMIHDSTGAMIETVSPTPPTPPAPTTFSVSFPQTACIRDGFGMFHVPAMTLTGTVNNPQAGGPRLLAALKFFCTNVVPFLPPQYAAPAALICSMLPKGIGAEVGWTPPASLLLVLRIICKEAPFVLQDPYKGYVAQLCSLLPASSGCNC